jgi:hypothetical protein
VTLCAELHGLRPARSARLLAAAGFASPFNPAEGIEFAAQHLPEIAMHDRHAALSVWNSSEETAARAAPARLDAHHPLTIRDPA